VSVSITWAYSIEALPSCYRVAKSLLGTETTHSLAQRPALANGNLITLLHTESRGHVGGKVLVTLLVTVVLGDEVEVLAADDDRSVHLGRDDSAGQDTATDRDVTGEGALLVYSNSVNPCSLLYPIQRLGQQGRYVL
jgi:hypothetical protein